MSVVLAPRVGSSGSLQRDWKAVIFDWAGTVVDYGSRAPVAAIVECFQQAGVAITPAEARGPMGRAKRDHLAALLATPEVARRWQAVHGRLPGEADLHRLYTDFLPLQQEVLLRCSHVIPGAPAAVAACRARRLGIGSTTGYTRELLAPLLEQARREGFDPAVALCADDTPAGRPAPWMIFRAAESLGAYPLSQVMVVDDTPVGLEAGRNAGAFAVGVAKTGNLMGLTEDEVAALSSNELERRLDAIRQELFAAGAHAVIDSVAELPELL